MSRSGFCTLFLLSLVVLTCTRRLDEGELGPPAPTLFGPLDDMAEVEKGIDAVPEENGIQLDWEVSDIEDLTALRLYRRSEENTLFQLLRIFDPTDTTYVDLDSMIVGKRFSYYMTAMDDAGREGVPSDTVDYMLVAKAFNLHNTLEPRPTFRWEVSEYPAEYVLKLFDLAEEEVVWFSSVQSDYTNQDEQVFYNRDGAATIDSLLAGHTYRWRVDVVGGARNSGSESNWRQFSL